MLTIIICTMYIHCWLFFIVLSFCVSSQGPLEFIWTEGCFGRSSNPGPALAILLLWYKGAFTNYVYKFCQLLTTYLPLFTLVDIWTTTYLPLYLSMLTCDKFFPYIDMYLVLLKSPSRYYLLGTSGKTVNICTPKI